MFNAIKNWWAVYVTGIVNPPAWPEEAIPVSELLKQFAAEEGEEWDDEI